jgi:uncharacterized protein involved in exopolysaccharide biosynthesis
VEPAVDLTLDERLRAVSDHVLSLTRLEQVILQFDLYRSDRGLRTDSRAIQVRALPTKRMEAAIERMRKDIDVDVDPNGQWFDIAYVSPDPQVAMHVANRLTALFIETSVRHREADRDVAVDVLDARIRDARLRLLARTETTPQTDPSDAEVRVLEHESLRRTYRDLLMKKEQAITFMNLERRQIAEQFKLLDPARLPDAPISPDRVRLTVLGAVIGFCLGVAMTLAGRSQSIRPPGKVLAQP